MRNTLVVNLDRCSGCDSCVTACKYANNLPLGEFYGRVYSVERGEFPNPTQYWVPKVCQQCENAQCVEVCPVGATYRDPQTNAVLINQDTCIGCQACIAACPFDARSMSEQRNVAQKCTLCGFASSTEHPDGDAPVCVHNCPCGARFFGDLDDPASDASLELAKYGEECIHVLADAAGALPTTRYILSPRVAVWDETAV